MNKIKNYILEKLYKKNWKNIEYFNVLWKERIKIMYLLINPNYKKILDLGCGKMWLKEFIGKDKIYYGSDYIDRGNNCIVCDFNLYEFPNIIAETIFISGCLEYIEDYMTFINKCCTSSKEIIISYCVMDDNRNNKLKNRLRYGWVNNLFFKDLITCFKNNGFVNNGFYINFNGNYITKFTKNDI